MDTKESLPSKPMARVGFICLVVGVLVLFGALLHFTWLKWGDPVVDTGREVEIPWKMAEGDVLYRDMAYNYGPFSPWVNSIFLKIFGTHLNSIVFSGIASSLLGLLLVFLVAREFLGRRMSCCVSALFLFECVFQHYYYNGNFCFILPYSFCAVHAMLAGLGAFWFLCKYINGKGAKPLLGAGICLGVAFLCKIEIAGAIAICVAALPVLLGIKLKAGVKRIGADTLSWCLPAAVVTIGGFLPFFLHASVGEVLWENVLKPQLVDFRSNIFFMQHLGLTHFQHNMKLIGLSLLMWSVFIAALLFCVSRFSKDRSNLTLKALLLVLAHAAGFWLWRDLNWEIEFRCLSVIIPVVFLFTLARIFLKKEASTNEEVKLLALSLFAGFSLMRIFLTVGTFHYGFCLALPGVILFVVVLIRWIPERFPGLVPKPGIYGSVLMLILLTLSARNFCTASLDNFNDRTVPIEGPQGKMWVQEKPLGMDIHLTLEMMGELADEGDTLLVLPEGAFVNFITGMRNPTRYNLFIPPELSENVEKELVARIEEGAIDWILLLNRPVWEFGSRGLGRDYGIELMTMVEKKFDRSISFGAEPYSGPEQGGCVLYRRK